MTLKPDHSQPTTRHVMPGRDFYHLTAEQVAEAMSAWLATQGVHVAPRRIKLRPNREEERGWPTKIPPWTLIVEAGGRDE